jgi:hypothetical protein
LCVVRSRNSVTESFWDRELKPFFQGKINLVLKAGDGCLSKQHHRHNKTIKYSGKKSEETLDTNEKDLKTSDETDPIDYDTELSDMDLLKEVAVMPKQNSQRMKQIMEMRDEKLNEEKMGDKKKMTMVMSKTSSSSTTMAGAKGGDCVRVGT